jgi:hypothetical protein
VSARPAQFSVSCTRTLRLVCRSRRDGALSRPAHISVSIQRHGRHPFAAALLPSIWAGTNQTRVFGWSSMRERCCYMSAVRASRPNVARVVRVSVAPRARRMARYRFHNPPTGRVRLRGLISAVSRASTECACASYITRSFPMQPTSASNTSTGASDTAANGQTGVISRLPVTDLQSLDELEKSLQQREQFHALVIDKKLRFCFGSLHIM